MWGVKTTAGPIRFTFLGCYFIKHFNTIIPWKAICFFRSTLFESMSIFTCTDTKTKLIINAVFCKVNKKLAGRVPPEVCQSCGLRLALCCRSVEHGDIWWHLWTPRCHLSGYKSICPFLWHNLAASSSMLCQQPPEHTSCSCSSRCHMVSTLIVLCPLEVDWWCFHLGWHPATLETLEKNCFCWVHNLTVPESLWSHNVSHQSIWMLKHLNVSY